MKLADAQVDNETMLLAALNVRGDALRLEYNWSERATIFLTSPYVRFLLFVGMLVLGWAELPRIPASQFLGSRLLICLVLLVGAPFLTGLACRCGDRRHSDRRRDHHCRPLGVWRHRPALAAPGFILVAIGLVAELHSQRSRRWDDAAAITH